MSYADEEYNDLVKSILSEGEHRMDRTGTGIIGKFTHTMSFDLTKGFPLLTTKRVYWDGCVSELLWFLRGQTNVNDLPKKVQQWWWPWADNDGDLGPIYGANWRNFGGDIDQLARLLNDLRQDPFSRRHVITLWDPATVHMANLPPCFLAGTIVATENGAYKPIEEVRVGDLVLDGDGVYQPVTKLWTTDFSGEVVKIKAKCIPTYITCTKNHPFLVRGKGWLHADQIRSGDYLAIPRIHTEELPTFQYVTERESGKFARSWVPTVDDFFTFGYFLGDGYCSHSNNPTSTKHTRRRVCFSVSDKTGVILSRLRKSIKVSKKPAKRGGCPVYMTSSLKWNSVLRQFGHLAHNKRIPGFVLRAPKDHVEAFLDGYLQSDGCEDAKRVRYATTSTDLAFGLQVLMAKVGKVASFGKRNKPPTTVIQGRTVSQRDWYEVDVRKSGSRKFADIDDNYVWVMVDTNTVEPFDGTVHNLEVANSHTYTANNLVNHNCHGTVIQFYVHRNEGGQMGLSCQMYQRSADAFLGVPVNIASYALLTHLVAHDLGFTPTRLVHVLGDAHIYENHLAAVETQQSRQGMEAPQLVINPSMPPLLDAIQNPNFASYLTLLNYNPHPSIKAPLAV